MAMAVCQQRMALFCFFNDKKCLGSYLLDPEKTFGLITSGNLGQLTSHMCLKFFLGIFFEWLGQTRLKSGFIQVLIRLSGSLNQA